LLYNEALFSGRTVVQRSHKVKPGAQVGFGPVLLPGGFHGLCAIHLLEERIPGILADIGIVIVAERIQLVADGITQRIIGNNDIFLSRYF
jgi:hypothetical protein